MRILSACVSVLCVSSVTAFAPLHNHGANTRCVEAETNTQLNYNKNYYSPSSPVGDNWSKGYQVPKREYYGACNDPKHRAPEDEPTGSTELTSALTPYNANDDAGKEKSPTNYYSQCTPIGDNARAGGFAPTREYYGAANDGSVYVDPVLASKPSYENAQGATLVTGSTHSNIYYESASKPIGDNWSKNYQVPAREYYGAMNDPRFRAQFDARAAAGSVARATSSPQLPAAASGPEPINWGAAAPAPAPAPEPEAEYVEEPAPIEEVPVAPAAPSFSYLESTAAPPAPAQAPMRPAPVFHGDLTTAEPVSGVFGSDEDTTNAAFGSPYSDYSPRAPLGDNSKFNQGYL